jgi:hypothetical protein
VGDQTPRMVKAMAPLPTARRGATPATGGAGRAAVRRRSAP